MNYQVILNELPLATVETLVEQNRHKGKGFFRKKPYEKLSYIKMVLWPIQHFEVCLRKKGSSETDSNIHAARNFMCGYFSIPYVETVLRSDGGRKALKTIFTRENQTLLSTRTRLAKFFPALPSYKPSEIYQQLNKSYLENRSLLEKQVVDTVQEMQPLYAEVDKYNVKINDLKDRIKEFNGDKKSSFYKNMKNKFRDYKKKARQLKRKADTTINQKEAQLKSFTKKWIRGKRRFLGIRPNFEIVKFGELGIFYQMYWIARLESSSSSRYLVINKNTQQVRKLQNMLNYDEKLRNELDSILEFTKTSTTISCYLCGAPTEKTQEICRNCSKKILKCSVCKLPISKGDQTASCPKCKSIAHQSHLHEWVKTQGKCPTCLQEVRLRNLSFSGDNN